MFVGIWRWTYGRKYSTSSLEGHERLSVFSDIAHFFENYKKETFPNFLLCPNCFNYYYNSTDIFSVSFFFLFLSPKFPFFFSEIVEKELCTESLTQLEIYSLSLERIQRKKLQWVVARCYGNNTDWGVKTREKGNSPTLPIVTWLFIISNKNEISSGSHENQDVAHLVNTLVEKNSFLRTRPKCDSVGGGIPDKEKK